MPEKGQAFGQRAKQAMSALVFGKDVELRYHATDRYGRLVCVVFVDDKDAGLELIRHGLAWAYERYLPEANPEIQAQYLATEDVKMLEIGETQISAPRSLHFLADRFGKMADAEMHRFEIIAVDSGFPCQKKD